MGTGTGAGHPRAVEPPVGSVVHPPPASPVRRQSPACAAKIRAHRAVHGTGFRSVQWILEGLKESGRSGIDRLLAVRRALDPPWLTGPGTMITGQLLPLLVTYLNVRFVEKLPFMQFNRLPKAAAITPLVLMPVSFASLFRLESTESEAYMIPVIFHKETERCYVHR